MSFPGPQKNKMAYFVHRLYQDNPGKQLTKQDIMPKVEAFEFAADVQVFFEELPEGQAFDEAGLINQLNEVIARRGRTDAVGGRLEKVDQVPAEWEKAYQEHYAEAYGKASGQGQQG